MDVALFLKHFGEHMLMFLHVILPAPGRFLVDFQCEPPAAPRGSWLDGKL